MEGNCSRSREMEGFSDGGRDSNKVVNASKKEVEEEEEEEWSTNILRSDYLILIYLMYYSCHKNTFLPPLRIFLPDEVKIV